MKVKLIIILILAVITPFNSAVAQSIDGTWNGKLKLGGGKSLTLVIHISADKRTVTMDSPDQGAYGIEGETILLNADSIFFSVPKLFMSYQGKLNENELTGTFQQGTFKQPLSLIPGDVKFNRPQTPQPPFPYTTEEVRIKVDDGSVVLAGTLTLPANYEKSTPVVVLISGSGQQNRDEEIFNHKPFAVIADHFARNGIATLRYDDRGVGGSIGNITDVTTEDFASDASAVMDWLRDQNRFGKIGLLGHSEGGLISFMLAASADRPDFIISIAGPAVNGTEIIKYQNRTAMLRSGASEEQAQQIGDAAIKKLLADKSNKWMQWFLTHNPADNLKRIEIPAMLIYGGKDRQVPAHMNVELAKKHAPEAIVKEYPGLNHLMQHATTGYVDEYNSIEETFAPELLSDITDFIHSFPR